MVPPPTRRIRRRRIHDRSGRLRGLLLLLVVLVTLLIRHDIALDCNLLLSGECLDRLVVFCAALDKDGKPYGGGG